MQRIKELDQQVAAVQKDEITYDKLRQLFQTTKKQSNFMLLYLNGCEKEGMTFDESQYLLEGFMLNTIEKGDNVREIVTEYEGVANTIYLSNKQLWIQVDDQHFKLDDVELYN
jgi:hypothetical protein